MLLRTARRSEIGSSADKTLVVAFGHPRTSTLVYQALRGNGWNLEAMASYAATPFANANSLTHD